MTTTVNYPINPQHHQQQQQQQPPAPQRVEPYTFVWILRDGVDEHDPRELVGPVLITSVDETHAWVAFRSNVNVSHPVKLADVVVVSDTDEKWNKPGALETYNFFTALVAGVAGGAETAAAAAAASGGGGGRVSTSNPTSPVVSSPMSQAALGDSNNHISASMSRSASAVGGGGSSSGMLLATVPGGDAEDRRSFEQTMREIQEVSAKTKPNNKKEEEKVQVTPGVAAAVAATTTTLSSSSPASAALSMTLSDSKCRCCEIKAAIKSGAEKSRAARRSTAYEREKQLATELRDWKQKLLLLAAKDRELAATVLADEASMLQRLEEYQRLQRERRANVAGRRENRCSCLSGKTAAVAIVPSPAATHGAREREIASLVNFTASLRSKHDLLA